MIKSVVNVEAERNDYPKLMASKSGVIVLFSKHGCGTIISSGEHYECGRWRDDWLMDVFNDFDGSITLSNGR